MFEPERAELVHFDDGFSSWNAYLISFVTDDTWGDHVILHGAANRFETCIHMINSPPRHYDVINCSNRLALGHAHELLVNDSNSPRVRSNKQTAVTNMWKTALLEKPISFNLTFRMLQYTSSAETLN